MTDITMDSTVTVSREQMSCGLDDEAVILSLERGTYYSLNPVGSRIWSLVQKPIRVRKINNAILEEFDVDAKMCEADLLSLLGELEKEGLIVVEGHNPS